MGEIAPREWTSARQRKADTGRDETRGVEGEGPDMEASRWRDVTTCEARAGRGDEHAARIMDPGGIATEKRPLTGFRRRCNRGLLTRRRSPGWRRTR